MWTFKDVNHAREWIDTDKFKAKRKQDIQNTTSKLATRQKLDPMASGGAKSTVREHFIKK
jgi:hypothetical protein